MNAALKRYIWRPMALADVAAVCAIEQVSHVLPWSMASFAQALQANNWAQVLCDDALVLGYCIMLRGVDDWELLNITIAPATRGQGLAKQGVALGIDAARGAGANKVFLEVRPSNIAALHCYYGLGFKQIAVRKRYYPTQQMGVREDALVLQLDVQ